MTCISGVGKRMKFHGSTRVRGLIADVLDSLRGGSQYYLHRCYRPLFPRHGEVQNI